MNRAAQLLAALLAILPVCALAQESDPAAVDVEVSGRLLATPLANVQPDLSLIGGIAKIGPAGHIYIGEGAGQGPRPLLVLLNGTGGSGRDLVEPLIPLADSTGIVLLGIDPRHENFDAVDRFFDDLDARRARARVAWPEPRFGKDRERIDETLAEVFRRVPIEPRHIGMLGYSHGGSYALMLGTANPQLFTSIAAISPGILVIPARQAGGQAIFLAHGRTDRVQPFHRTACVMAPRLRSFGNSVLFYGHDGGHALESESLRRSIVHFLDPDDASLAVETEVGCDENGAD